MNKKRHILRKHPPQHYVHKPILQSHHNSFFLVNFVNSAKFLRLNGLRGSRMLLRETKFNFIGYISKINLLILLFYFFSKFGGERRR